MALVDVPPGCTVESETIALEHPAPARWIERSVVVIRAKEACDRVVLDLPAGVHLRERDVRLILGDDTRRHPGSERWILDDRGLDDTGTATVLLPELVGGDRAKLTFTREWEASGWYATPMRDRAIDVLVTLPKDVRSEWRGGKLDGLAWRGTKEQPAEGISAWDASLAPAPVTTKDAALSVDAAAARIAGVTRVPRGVDGLEPVAGDAGLERGLMDDRGLARTLVALTRGGPEPLELAWYLPPGVVPTGASDTLGPVEQAYEVAILRKDGKLVREVVPENVHPTGRIWTADHQVLPGSTVGHGVGRIGPKHVRITDTTKLVVPDGDPQAKLFPGGGSSVERQLRFDFQPYDDPQVYYVPLPTTAPPAWKAGPGWAIRGREDATLIVVQRSPDDPVRVETTASKPDAPTCGALPTWPWADTTATVTDPKGVVRTEGRFWWLAEHGGKPVMPDRERVLRGLQYRFTSSSYPEPGIPMDLRGMPAGWDLAAALRDAVFERARIADLAVPRNWPRNLKKSMKEEVLTPLEAAMVLRLYLLQARMPADLVLVRPIQEGPGPDVCPDAYGAALVRTLWEGEERWMDPGCTVCGPFEVRPDLLGAAAFGFDVAETPPPPKGSLDWSVDGDTTTVTLDPPAALALRLWLQSIPKAEREERLAERFGGDGAVLLRGDGVGDRGAPITLVVRSPNPDRPDPSGESEDGWWPFVGQLRYDAPSPPDGRAMVRVPVETGHGAVLVPVVRDGIGPFHADLGGVVYERTVGSGRVTEVLTIRDRKRASDLDAALTHARSADSVAPTPKASPNPRIGVVRGAAVKLRTRDGERPLPPGSLVSVLGAVDADSALVTPSTDGSLYGRAPRASLVALPFRSRLKAKSAAITVRDLPSPQGKRGISVPVAGGPVWVVDAIPGWVQIDVEGPDSDEHPGGWIEVGSLDPALAGTPEDPSALGDWTMDRWSARDATSVVLDADATFRGLTLPADTVVHLRKDGRIEAVELFREWTDGADTRLPAGSRLTATERCDLQVVAPAAALVGGSPIPTGLPACLTIKEGHPRLSP